MTEVLPESWEEVELRRVVSKLVDGSHNPPKKQDSGKPMLSARNIENNAIVFDAYRYIHPDDFEAEHKRTRVQTNDVLLTIVGTIGRTAVVPPGLEDFTLQRSVAVLTPEGVLPKFLMYQLQAPHVQRYFEQNARGTAQKGVYLKTLGQTPVRVAPLADQTRIVAEIEKQFSRLDEAVANLKRVKANLKRYKAAVLKAAVEGKLTEEWRKAHPDVEPASKLLDRILAERRAKWEEAELAKMQAKGKAPKNDKWKAKYKEPAALDTTDLPDLPDGWVWATAVQACNPVVDCHNKTAPYVDSGIPLVRTSNIRNGKLLLDDVRYVDRPTYDFWSRRCPPEPGDILFTREAPMGEAAIIPQGAKLCMGQRMMLMRPSPAVQDVFLLYSLQSPVVKRLIDRTAVGSGVKHLRVGDVELIPIPIPPHEEQQHIVSEADRRLSLVGEAEAQIDTNLKRAERLRQAILATAFSGSLAQDNVPEQPAASASGS